MYKGDNSLHYLKNLSIMPFGVFLVKLYRLFFMVWRCACDLDTILRWD